MSESRFSVFSAGKCWAMRNLVSRTCGACSARPSSESREDDSRERSDRHNDVRPNRHDREVILLHARRPQHGRRWYYVEVLRRDGHRTAYGVGVPAQRPVCELTLCGSP
jgi:hypothetical protein